MNYPIITKAIVKRNRDVKKIQKVARKKYRAIKAKYPKARIDKVVEIRAEKGFIDLVGEKLCKVTTQNLDKDQILGRIKQGNISGLSGSGFPTTKKIDEVMNSKASKRYLIVNGVECDPGLLHDAWLLHNRYQEITNGIELLRKCIPFDEVILATKEDIKEKSKGFNVRRVASRYPMGAERILINEVLGIQLTAMEIPARKGILVINVQTVLAIYEAVSQEKTVDSRYLTVSDMTCGEAVIAKVALGANARDTLTKVLGERKGRNAYIGGGAMSAKELSREDSIEAKTNFVGYGESVRYQNDSKCKKCGACARKCPMNIRVDRIVQSVEKGETAAIKSYQPENCIECGSCTYFCNAGKNTMAIVSDFRERR
ncbi:MAG TPA: 4Fe-4S dicluster domain-containing protein [Lachnospiraceae bacterium]|nr:4Fe-4S dicluster domain-containing protein [Lachnospiraceae bacterium]